MATKKPKRTASYCLICEAELPINTFDFCSKKHKEQYIKVTPKLIPGIPVKINDRTWVSAKSEEDIPRIKKLWQDRIGSGVTAEKVIPVKDNSQYERDWRIKNGKQKPLK